MWDVSAGGQVLTVTCMNGSRCACLVCTWEPESLVAELMDCRLDYGEPACSIDFSIMYLWDLGLHADIA